MTGLKVALLALLAVLMIVPGALARTEVSKEESAAVDALELYAGVTLGAETEEASPDQDVAYADSAFMARFIPKDSDVVSLLGLFFLTLEAQQLAPIEEPSADVETPAVDAQSEADALMEKGVGTEGTTHASNAEVSAAVEVQAGDHQQSASASARPVEELPVQAVQGVPVLGPGSEAAGEPMSAPEAPQAQAAAPSDEEPGQGSSEIAPLVNSLQSTISQPISLPAAIATTVAVLGASTTTAVLVVPGWRTALLRALKRFGWLVLFSRIAQEDILNHGRRSELLEYIRNNPGERVEVARRALGFSNGSMHYHLRVLQDRGLVKLLKEGSLARLYPRGPKINPAPYVPAQRKRFLDALSNAPGVTQRELSAALGLSERMVSYHVKELASQGLVEVRPEGARKRLFPSQACTVAPAVLVPAS